MPKRRADRVAGRESRQAVRATSASDPRPHVGRVAGLWRQGQEATVFSNRVRLFAELLVRASELVRDPLVAGAEPGGVDEHVARLSVIADDRRLVAERHEPPNVWRVVARRGDACRRRGTGQGARRGQRAFRGELLRVSGPGERSRQEKDKPGERLRKASTE